MNLSTLKNRKKLSKITSLLNTKFSKCKCCRVTWNYVRGKSLSYSSTGGYFPICEICFNDEYVSFFKIVEFYTIREDFSEIEINHMMNSIMDEVLITGSLKEKYEQYIIECRNNKIENVLSS